MKWIKFTFGMLLGLLLMGTATIYQWLNRVDAEGVLGAVRSARSLSAAAATEACATPHHYRAAAERYGWKVEEVDSRNIPIVTSEPEKVRTALRIYLEPVAPFSKKPFKTYRFDKKGCIMG